MPDTRVDARAGSRWRSSILLVGATLVAATVAAGLWAIGLQDAARWICAAFASGVAALQALRMLRQLRAGRLGIDVLAIVAIAATVAVGELVAAMIIVLMIAGGRALEEFANGRAARELDALLAREPRTAHRCTVGSDAVVDVPVAEVRIGDRVLVRSGEVVPVDGSLETGAASFDESSLTGESMPRLRTQGDPVLSGSVAQHTASTIVATAAAADSQYQGIVALVRAASSDRAPVVRLADRYAVPFTIVSLLVAGIAWLASGDPVRFAEVLVLATPCPLLVAAPVAFVGGMSRASRAGIIVKGGGVLEQLSRVRSVVLDKTGTLTTGHPTITRIVTDGAHDADELLSLAASAETLSSHVLAASIVAAARARGLTIATASDATEVAARGVSARVGPHAVAVGTLDFVRELDPTATRASVVGGELAISVAIDGRAAGSIVASDPIRSDARATLDALRRQGATSITMLTGDARATAEHVARELDITSVRADCLPIDKVEAVRSMTSRPVLMVGDGVNDAPVLAVADVGIAMGARGATAASESASAVILVDDLSLVSHAVTIGQDTVRIALQSIWIGMALSVALMLVAAFGLIPATIGAAIQELVDLVTILGALRALRPRERRIRQA